MILPALLASMALAQEPVQWPRLADAHAAAVRIAQAWTDSIWPGFRLDTIPVLYVLPDTGTALFGWRGDLPAGFTLVTATPGAGWQAAAARGAASTGTTLAGRPAAQVVAGGASVAQLVGLTAHEAFHVFQSASRRPGRRFSAGENSFLVASYPIFDAANEAGVALEGRVLAAALGAHNPAGRREAVRQFVAARDGRQRRLGDEYATFERLGELNEGLAEYAQLRILMLASRERRLPWADAARQLVARGIAALDSLTRDNTRSIRLRFYVTGPAQAFLLDAMEGPGWKSRLMRDDLTIQEALATQSGWREPEIAAQKRAETFFGGAALRRAADSSVAGLRALRRAQVDSLLAAPGMQLVVVLDSLPGSRVGLCMIDPQNLLQVDAGVLLHTRAVRACAGAALDASFTTPVLDERAAGAMRAVIGPLDSLRVTSAGRPVVLRDGQDALTLPDLRIESGAVALTSRRAEITLRGRTLNVRPKP